MMVPPEERAVRLCQRRLRIWRGALFLACVPLICSTAYAQNKGKYVCGEPQPAAMCTPENTCGSGSTPCIVNINKSSGDSSNVKPGTPNAKNNQFFCIKAGTTVVWRTSNKNTGFVIFFGTDSPFDPDAPITGGGNKQVTVRANTPGCYKYDAGAFFSGAIYGMSGASKRELVILP